MAYFYPPTPIRGKISGVPLGVVGLAKSEDPRLSNRVIIFEEFNLCDRDTWTSRSDRQSDGRTTCRSIAR